jgi:hypothetical protein
MANKATPDRLLNGLARRSAIRLLLTGAGLLSVAPHLVAEALARAGKRTKSTNSTSPFEWHPERAPVGPLAIIVSLTRQRVFVYRNGIQIGTSRCSTGKTGHETPTGVFTILQKAKEHYSSTYDDAPMPFMERLTWDGVALHAGKVAAYPASHGCVRLPEMFAAKLYEVTQIGTPVIIASDHTQPAAVFDPGLILGAKAKEELGKATKKKAAVKAKTNPRFATTDAVTSILVSRADKWIFVLQNGDIVAQGQVSIANPGKTTRLPCLCPSERR